MNAERNEQEYLVERQIDGALKSYPVAPLPPAFTRQVMAQIQVTPQDVPVAAVPSSLRHYFHLYSFEFVSATVLTMVLVLGIGWPLLAQVLLLPAAGVDGVTVATHFVTLLGPSFSPWYVAGLCGVVLLEIGIAWVVWVAWMEQPRLKV
ncbi:MAG: hypothetical protein R3E79_05775 [Caldilineaceae bacterium]